MRRKGGMESKKNWYSRDLVVVSPCEGEGV